MTILFIIISIMAVVGAPLFTAMGGLAILNFLKENLLLIVPQEISGLASIPLLHSIPLFTIAGYILAESKASTRLVRFSRALLGWMPGGMALVTLVVCAVFTAFTGGSGVTIVAIGGFLLPALLSEKYEEDFSLGLITTSGSLGLLFPPSLPIILFGVMTSVSIGEMFIAGAIPGVFLIIVLSIYCVIRSRKFNFVKVPFSWRELGKATWEIKWELPLPFLLIAGILTGKITISDSAAFTVLYVFIVEVFCTKDIKIKNIPQIMKKAMILVGSILIILAVSLASSNYIVYKQIPDQIFNAIKDVITNKIMFLLMLNIFLIIVGCLMDIFSALVVIIPLILPLAEAYNVDYVHLGIIFILNLEMGYITPPVGMNLFISSVRFDQPILKICKSVLPFIAISFISLMIVTYLPIMSMWHISEPAIQGKWTCVESVSHEHSAEEDEFEISGEQTMKTEIVLKANNVLYYKKYDANDIFAQFADPQRGTYKYDKKDLILTVGDETLSYKYEIFKRGEKLLLINDNNEQNFYENEIKPPLDKYAGRLTSYFSDEDGNSFDFYLNGRTKFEYMGDCGEGRYKVTKSKIIIYPDELGEEKSQEIEFKYRLTDDGCLQLRQSKNVIMLKCIGSENNN